MVRARSAKSWPGLVGEEHDGQEDGDGGRGGGEQRAPYLLRPHERRFLRVHASLAQPDDVLQHHDGRIEGHPHREREARQRDDVEGPPGEVERQERREEGHRDRDRDQQRRAQAVQEPPQHPDRERHAEAQVVAHHREGAVDVDGLVVNLFEGEPRALERPLGQLRRGLPEPRHHFEDVHPDLSVGVHRDRSHSPGEDEALAIDEGHFGVRDVPQPHRESVAPLEDQLAKPLGVHRAGEAQGVAALADAHVAAGGVLVGAGQASRRGQVDAEARRLVRIEGDADLALAPPVDLGARHPGDALQTGLHDLFGVVLVALDIARVPLPGAGDEPRDGAAPPADGIDHRLVRVLGVAGNPVQAVEHFDEPAAQIVADREFDGDFALPALGLGNDAGHPGQPAQHLLLRLDDLRLHLLGRGGAPRGADGDLRSLDLGRQLDRQARKAEAAEQDDEQYRDQRRGGVGEREPGPAHAEASAVDGAGGEVAGPGMESADRARLMSGVRRPSRRPPTARNAAARRPGSPRGRRGRRRRSR